MNASLSYLYRRGGRGTSQPPPVVDWALTPTEPNPPSAGLLPAYPLFLHSSWGRACGRWAPRLSGWLWVAAGSSQPLSW